MDTERPRFKMTILDGGCYPKRQTEGAIGYDVSARAVVCPFNMDTKRPDLRATLFDFQSIPSNPSIAQYVEWQDATVDHPRRLIYRLEPGKRVLVGIGFFIAMEFPWYYWVSPRSGLASKFGITVANSPGTIDPDYRGEAGVSLLHCGEGPFRSGHGDRIAQIIFNKAGIPEFELVDKEFLSATVRGAGGFGSTGI